MIKNSITVISFIAVLFFSVGLKITSIHHDPINNQKNDLDLISKKIMPHHWHEQERVNLLNNDHLIATSYKNTNCPNTQIYTVPLYRNSENVPVVEKRLITTDSKLTFFYNGTSYERFPSLSFWLGHNFQRIYGLFGQSNKSSHYVLGVITDNSICPINTIKWEDI